jgi:hypothetical protein
VTDINPNVEAVVSAMRRDFVGWQLDQDQATEEDTTLILTELATAAIKGLQERGWVERGVIGDFVKDGGIWGVIIRCPQCNGQGALHKPVGLPKGVEATHG